MKNPSSVIGLCLILAGSFSIGYNMDRYELAVVEPIHNEKEAQTVSELAELSVMVAYCESKIRNVGNLASSAYGIFQFIDSTWDNRCEGDKDNVEDNIRCGVKLLNLGEYHHWDSSINCWR